MTNRTQTDAEIVAQIPAARKREARERRQGLRAVDAKYQRATHRVVLELTNGYSFAFPVTVIHALDRATPAQVAAVQLDSSGGALRWESLDVDVSVPGLLLSALGVEERLRHLASLAGRVSSDAKARAARANGLKGGRPPKRAGKRKAKSG
jgi:hypothetical protein